MRKGNTEEIELPISLVVPSEEFELREILIRADIDREVFATFDEETVVAIQEEVGLSSGLLPKLTDAEIQKITRNVECNIDKLEDIPKVNSPTFGSYFADVYLNGTYKFEGGYVTYTARRIKERGKVLNLEGLSREFLLHPESIVKIRKHLKINRKSDRIEQSLRHLGFAFGVIMGRFDAQMGCLVDMAEDKRKEYNIKKDSNAPKPFQEGAYFTSLEDLRPTISSSVKSVDEKVIERLKDVLDYKLGKEKSKLVWDEMELTFLRDCEELPSDPKKNWSWFFREKFFELHLSKYENRPIYFPLSSKRKNFVFYFNIHTWNSGTFSFILSDFLNPDLKAMKARLVNLQDGKVNASASESKQIDKDIINLQRYVSELEEFRDTLEEINTTGIHSNKLEAKVSYFMDLDDGVMVNSSALYPLLEPQWKKPKEIWENILVPKGKKDYDWSHLAMRYFPKRVLEKCKKDPSLAVAHSNYGSLQGRDLFKEFHPDASKKWEERNSEDADKKEDSSIPTFPGMESADFPKAKKTAAKKKRK
ncbi:hypothetical protein [Leptospira bouyouniensis]|uniref:Uncharacterized protein n=1 Tax=Leptospira bouyouniensis TaxID=2484911 RepID=A0ABY2KZ85_9LEPT|nr:hypothetical protein [Leptospira bouyouniensis]TGK45906.1 hypothetical protein EHQ10_18555 [Leptospira bouyouniensis]